MTGQGNISGNIGEVSRRALLSAGLASGFLLAFHVPVRAVNEPEQPPDDTVGKFAPNAFIRIDHSGKTTLVMPQVEMGQGTYTSISMILAEELDADFAKVAVEHAPPSDKLYANPVFGIQVTGNSNSVRSFWEPLRNAGASARAMLVQAAAQQWQVDAASCTTAKGEVLHAASGRRLAYGELVDAANTQTPPKNVVLKDPKVPKEQGARAAIGDPLPPGVATQPFPADVAQKIPALRSHRFFVTDQEVVIVDPKENKIVDAFN